MHTRCRWAPGTVLALLVVPRLPGSSSLAVLWCPQALVAAGGTVALNCHLKQSTAWDSVHHTFAKRLGGVGGTAMAAGLCLVIMPSGGPGCRRCWSSPGWLSSALSLHYMGLFEILQNRGLEDPLPRSVFN